MQRRAEAHSGDAVPIQLARAEADDELSLVDLWFVVRGRWPWLLAGLLAGLVGALAYIILTTSTYESRAVVQIGKLPVTGPIADMEALTAHLISEYGADPGDGTKRRMPYLEEAAAKGGNSSMLEMRSVGHSPGEARSLLTRVIADLTQRHEQVYESAVDPLRQRLKGIEKEVDLLRAQAAELDDLIARLRESQPVQAALAAIERARLYGELNELERHRVELQQQIIQPYSLPTRLIVPASLAVEPNAPRKTVAVVIGFVIGLMLGLLAVFAREFSHKAQAVAKSSHPR